MDHPRHALKYVSVKDRDQLRMSFENFSVEDPSGQKLGKLEGFILDLDRTFPYYVVVNAGGWFHSKHVLVPIGHVALDSESKRLVADVPKERIERFPGFDLDLFQKLTQADLDKMADEIAQACCPDIVAEPLELTRFEVWAHYRTPVWWEDSGRDDRQPSGKPAGSTAESKR